MSGRAAGAQAGPVEELAAVGLRVRRLADGLARLPALAGALSVYGGLLADPLARLAEVVGPLAAVPALAEPAPAPATLPAYTWPDGPAWSAGQAAAFSRPAAPAPDTVAAASRPTAPAPGTLAASSRRWHFAAQAASGRAGGRPGLPVVTQGARIGAEPWPAVSAERPPDAAGLRLTRDRASLATALRANLAPAGALPGGRAADGAPHPADGTHTARWPEPAAAAEDEHRPGQSPDRSRAGQAASMGGPSLAAPDEPGRSSLLPESGRQAWEQAAAWPARPGPPAAAGARREGRSAAGNAATSPERLPWPGESAARGAAPAGPEALAGQYTAPGPTWHDTLPTAGEDVADARPATGRARAGEPPLDEILEALADQLELALLRAYGTSGGG